MNGHFDLRLVIGVGLIVALLILGAVLTYHNTQRLNEDAGWVAHTHEVSEVTSKVLLTLLDAEAREQGYLITGDDHFLQPFHTALDRLDEHLVSLEDMTKDNADQQARIKKLQEMSHEHVALLREAIELRRKKEGNREPYLSITNKAWATMDGIRGVISKMQAEEHGLLMERERQLDQAYRVAVFTGLLTAVVGLVLVGAFVWLLQRGLSDHRRAEQDRAETDRRKNEFLATLAHELRNPLAPIRNAIELLRFVNGNADLVDKARGIMERQLEQVIRLVDDLLDISRIERGKVQIRKKRIDLAEAVQIAIETARPHMEASSHKLTVEMPSEPIYLDADTSRLAQVISNLLNNAARYTEKGGCISLTAQRQDNEAIVSVKDNGVGIASEQLPQLFEMFSQVGTESQGSQGGLGIGLALVRGLVELHGGRVEARSDGMGKGSEFRVHLPIN
jgi:signal transduction histidine kinase